MNDYQKIELNLARLHMKEAGRALERLECGGGSGATTCYAGREAEGEQGGVDEERSDREDRRVTPGEAKAQDVEFIKCLRSEEERCRRNQSLLREQNLLSASRDAAIRANAVEWCYLKWFEIKEPEPDSEAPKERSGRRNSD